MRRFLKYTFLSLDISRKFEFWQSNLSEKSLFKFVLDDLEKSQRKLSMESLVQDK
jgi:hypothetical protein